MFTQLTRDDASRITDVNGVTTSDHWTYTNDELDGLLTAATVGDAAMNRSSPTLPMIISSRAHAIHLAI